MKRAADVSDAEADAVFAHIFQDHVALKQACHLEGVDYNSFRGSLREDDGGRGRANWTAAYRKAQASSEVFWIKFLEDCGREKNTAGVKAAESALRAVNRERWREKEQGTGERVVVNINSTPEPVTLQATVVGQKALGEGPTASEVAIRTAIEGQDGG